VKRAQSFRTEPFFVVKRLADEVESNETTIFILVNRKSLPDKNYANAPLMNELFEGQV
jgi:hypothetical protein